MLVQLDASGTHNLDLHFAGLSARDLVYTHQGMKEAGVWSSGMVPTGPHWASKAQTRQQT